MAKSKELIPIELQTKCFDGTITKEELNDIVKNYIVGPIELNTIGSGYRNLDEFDLAEKYFKESIKQGKIYGEAYGNLMSLYIAQKKYDLCEKTFKKAIKEKANSEDFIYYQQGRAYNQQGLPHKALNMATKGLGIRKDWEPLYLLGIHSEIKMGMNSKEAGQPEEQTQSFFEGAAKAIKIAHHLFPKSKEVQELYDDFFGD